MALRSHAGLCVEIPSISVIIGMGLEFYHSGYGDIHITAFCIDSLESAVLRRRLLQGGRRGGFQGYQKGALHCLVWGLVRFGEYVTVVY